MKVLLLAIEAAILGGRRRRHGVHSMLADMPQRRDSLQESS